MKNYQKNFTTVRIGTDLKKRFNSLREKVEKTREIPFHSDHYFIMWMLNRANYTYHKR